MKIDINCDLGEGIGNDADIMPLISSCNIACGGHAGNAKSMHTTLVLANRYGVKIGAHPSFPDVENFGRKSLNITAKELTKSIYKQIVNLKFEADKLKLKISHIKPHGALYNLATVNKDTAKAIVEAIKMAQLKVKLYAPYKSVLASLAIEEKIEVCYEAFMDRQYNNDLTLVSRQHKNAVISDPDMVLNQLSNIVFNQKLKCVTGEMVDIQAETFCIHGDNKMAVSILQHLHKRLEENNVSLTKQ